jgi:hypothetical protein
MCKNINILNDIKNIYFDIINSENSSNNNNNNSIVAIDGTYGTYGTYGNTNIKKKLQTLLFMYYYDITNNVLLDINFKL